MAKLITDHDPYHVHKVLGLLALLHYIYRFGLLYRYGNAFPSSESTIIATCGVFLHGLLSWSSLLLPLPNKRNFNKPMIWPEFRLHSITFATRHVVATLLTLNNLWPDENDHVILHAMARAAVVLGAVKAASYITDRYGNREQRTTNSMPYPDAVSPEQRVGIKKSYALAQFAATAVCLLPDASMNFAPLLAIQMAPLMMTLVRKGKVGAGTYHRVYAVSLYLGYVMVLVRLLAKGDGNDIRGVSKSVGLKTVFMLCFPSSKLRRLVSPFMVWSVNVVLSAVLYPMVLRDVINDTVADDVARMVFWFVTFVGTAKQIMVYAPLFGMTRLKFSMSIGEQLKEAATSRECGGDEVLSKEKDK